MNTINYILPKKDSLFEPLNSIRVKITDSCKWNCYWCHNEGTGSRTKKLIQEIDFFNEKFWEEFVKFTKLLNITEVHLTGGEPSLHPKISEIIKKLNSNNYIVKMTSIGSEKYIFDKIIMSGIHSINFSLHAINKEHMYETQINRSKKSIDYNHKKLLEIIEYSKNKGIDIKINTVLANKKDFERANDVLQWASKRKIPVRLLPEINKNKESIRAIIEFLKSLRAKESRRKYILGSSSGTIFYNIPKIGEIGFKVLIPNYLNSMCKQCKIKELGMCNEYFYGIRLEKRLDDFYLRLCIHKTSEETFFRMKDSINSMVFNEIKMKRLCKRRED
ncbi:radical SAM protein [Leptotrichia sp. OH3620_COT-345]|uniref:radical SAM protein n=1 Tax=Leptotrichia sp. OH3620_COT-345 TaxID=2491048 RepID=UPI000F646A7E|nr:radical SAM protein [Leptotrichia sp. OH3620_COT-345]RRD39355.1 radical SAM protein [Leptotrichia sp. OH3620_COT-345]